MSLILTRNTLAILMDGCGVLKTAQSLWMCLLWPRTTNFALDPSSTCTHHSLSPSILTRTWGQQSCTWVNSFVAIER